MDPYSDTAHIETRQKGSFFNKAKAEFSRIQKMMLRKLTKSKQTGNMIAVSSYALGEGTFLSVVEDIYKNGPEDVVVLKWYDNNNLASRTHIFLEEILSITSTDKKINQRSYSL